MLSNKCNCKNNKLIIVTEKMYEGCINEKDVLVCEPEDEFIIEIKCSKCGKKYKVKDFNEIEY
jgi:hypothetical protein